jgi:hypothetical protein
MLLLADMTAAHPRMIMSHARGTLSTPDLATLLSRLEVIVVFFVASKFAFRKITYVLSTLMSSPKNALTCWPVHSIRTRWSQQQVQSWSFRALMNYSSFKSTSGHSHMGDLQGTELERDGEQMTSVRDLL